VNWNHQARKILITGKSGSGKTTLWLSMLEKWRAGYKFVFDPELETSRKLGWKYSNSPASMVQAVKLRLPVVFYPSDMFPGNRPAAFDFFCRWVYGVSCVLQGHKLLAVDEVWKYVPPRRPVPQSFQEILDDGRKQEIDLLLVSQRPNRTHDAIRAVLTETVTFHHHERLPLAWLEEDGFDPEAVKRLAYPGGYLRQSLIHADTPRKGSSAPPAGG
jgi:energy-coupling factor transporter ATP-binding protein EcfA2